MIVMQRRGLSAVLVLASVVLIGIASLVHAGSYEVGRRLLEGKSYSKAASAFRAASSQGNAAAERELGFLYYNGLGFRQNAATAIQWFDKAAAHGDVQAQAMLGQIYENGLSVQQNNALSAKYFEMAADHGDQHSQLRMGEIRYLGSGVERNHAEAAKWWELATTGDDDSAQRLHATIQPAWDRISPEDRAEGHRRANEWTAARLTQRGG
jgi:TPR repeat protein